MEHPFQKKTEEVIGFDLERKVIIFAKSGDGFCRVEALTDDQVRRLRLFWRFITETARRPWHC